MSQNVENEIDENIIGDDRKKMQDDKNVDDEDRFKQMKNEKDLKTDINLVEGNFNEENANTILMSDGADKYEHFDVRKNENFNTREEDRHEYSIREIKHASTKEYNDNKIQNNLQRQVDDTININDANLCKKHFNEPRITSSELYNSFNADETSKINPQSKIFSKFEQDNCNYNLPDDSSNLYPQTKPNSISQDNILNIKTLLPHSIKLFKTSEEFFYISIFLLIWLSLNFIELIYGIATSQVYVISDSFFNYFKTFAFLIAGISFLLTRINLNVSPFLKNRIELIAALSNCVFLIIVSLYMCLQALHMISDDHHEKEEHSHLHEKDTISFFKNFFIVKVVINVLGILAFSDYLMHPSIQIKLLLWKNHREWKPLNELSLNNLKESKSLIKNWNNHFENMNALSVHIFSDLISSILFLVCFYLSKDKHFEGVYFLISLVNFAVLIFLLSPLMNSIIKILMQGRSELYECFYSHLNKEVSYFEGCLGLIEMKFWMTAQNEIKCIIILIYFNRYDENICQW